MKEWYLLALICIPLLMSEIDYLLRYLKCIYISFSMYLLMDFSIRGHFYVLGKLCKL